MADRPQLTKSESCDHVPPMASKQVRWSVDLEEIVYFTPPKPRRKSITERFREFKDKANDFADRTFRPIGQYRIARRELKRAHTIDIETDLNSQWDILFELYKDRVMNDWRNTKVDVESCS